MKKYKLLGLCLALAMGSLASCDDNDDAPILDTKVYINTETIPVNFLKGGSVVENYITDKTDASFEVKFPVRITMPYSRDVQVELSIKPELVAAYNEANGTHYTLLNKEALKIENTTLTIPKGKMQSTDSLKITFVDSSKMGEGTSFGLPIAITGVTKSSDLKISTNQYFVWTTVEKSILNVKVVDAVPGTIVDHSKWVANSEAVGTIFTDEDVTSSRRLYRGDKISYDLGGEETYKGFSITSNYGQYANYHMDPETITFEISENGTDWQNIGVTTMIPTESGDASNPYIQYVQFVKPVKASHIRFTFTDAPGKYGYILFSELNLYK
ncbi:MAG: DUF1735 domain-containing protein [Bacteroidaceae bacterium]